MAPLIPVAATCALALLTCGAATGATNGRTSTSELAACASKKTGALRLLKKPSAKCKKSERKVRWATRGPAGAAGSPGQSGLHAALASGEPVINTAADWTTVLVTSFVGQPGMVYNWTSSWYSNRPRVCPGGDEFNVYTRVLANGAESPGWPFWRRVTGPMNLEMQVRVGRSTGPGWDSPCQTGSDFSIGATELFANAAALPGSGAP